MDESRHSCQCRIVAHSSDKYGIEAVDPLDCRLRCAFRGDANIIDVAMVASSAVRLVVVKIDALNSFSVDVGS